MDNNDLVKDVMDEATDLDNFDFDNSISKTAVSTEQKKEGTKTTEPPSKKKKNNDELAQLLSTSVNAHSEGDIVEGAVIAIDKTAIYIDLPPIGTGIIFGREFINARDVIKKVHVGDTIAAKVVLSENEDGYIELSLKEARQALIWNEADAIIKERRALEILVKEANKGGLILDWQGISGFLPASQLKSDHYPRVKDGDKDRILEELKKLVGTRISVTMISALPEEGKLIFSEKSSEQKEKQDIIDKFNVDDEAEGEITGMVDFGVFVKIEDGLEGLVHISELDWALVEDPRKLFSIGDKVNVKIIEIKDGKISLSIKALKNNPWVKAQKKYNRGDKVEGVIIKYNKHGALASIEEGIAGLVHISEFESDEALRQTLELGKTYEFLITLFDASEQRIALSYKTDEPSQIDKKTETKSTDNKKKAKNVEEDKETEKMDDVINVEV